jgi:hypothetical protein
MAVSRDPDFKPFSTISMMCLGHTRRLTADGLLLLLCPKEMNGPRQTILDLNQ